VTTSIDYQRSSNIHTNIDQSMSLFPNVLNLSTYDIMLAQQHHERGHSIPTTSTTTQRHASSFLPATTTHHFANFLANFLTCMFTPISCQQCTASTSKPAIEGYNTRAVDDVDECALLDEEEDGQADDAPLCREAMIESWKTTARRERRERFRGA
jgi:hypothetical protein